MSPSDDAEQWRSAIDPKSGKTYWYHRVNRISTWIKPPFMPDLLTSPAVCSVTSSPLIRQVAQESRGPNVEKLTDHQHTADLVVNDAKSMEENKPSDVVIESQNELQGSLPQDLSVSIQNAVSCLTRSEEHFRIDALLLLSSRCGIAAEITVQLSKTPSLLSNLVAIISRGESKKCRRLALSILCSLAICRASSSIFQDNQSWVIISRKFLYWEGDKESTLLFCILICCLLDRPARCVIPSETVESIGDLLGFMLDDYRNYSKSGQIDLLSLRMLSSGSSSSFSVGDWNFLYCLFIGAEKGYHTSSLLLLVILSSAVGSIQNTSIKEGVGEESYIKESGLVHDILKTGGGASILRSLCSAINVHETVRRRARDLLLEGTAKSSYLRETVVDGFLNLSFGYSFQQCVEKKVEDSDLSREEDTDDSQRRGEAVLPLGASTEFKGQGLQQKAARNILDVSWRSCREGEREGRTVWEDEQNLNSGDDEDVDEDEDEESKSSRSLRLSSVSVWALCPGLRPALTECFTAATTPNPTPDPTQSVGIREQGPLRVPTCFAVDTSHEALLYVTRYVRCGVLLVPAESLGEDPTVLLEMMKLATRWGMQPLLEEISEIVSSVLTEDCLDECELYGHTYAVPALVSVCRAFRAESEAMAYQEQESRRAALLGGGYSGSAAYPVHPSKDSIDFTRQQAEYHLSENERETTYDSIYGNESSLDETDTASDGYRLLGMYTKHLVPEGGGDGNEMYGARSRQKLLRDLYRPECEDERHTIRHPELPYEREKEKEKKKPKSGGIYGLLLKSSIDSGHDSAEIRYTGEDPGPGPGLGSVRGYVSPAAEWKGSAGTVSGSAQHSVDVRGRTERQVGSSESISTRAHDIIGDNSTGKIGRNNYNGTVTATYRNNAQHSQNNNNNSSSSSGSSMAAKVLAVPVHLRPKSAFGRRSIGEDSTRKTPLKRPTAATIESVGSATPSMYEEHTHRRYDSTSRSQTPRRYKTAAGGGGGGVGQTSEADEGSEVGVRRGSQPGSGPATPTRKYSSSGRVSVAPSGSSGTTSDSMTHDRNSSSGVREGISTGHSGGRRSDSNSSGSQHRGGGGVGGVGGAPKVAAVFRLLENSIEQEIAATKQMESRHAAAHPAHDVPPLLGGSNEDDDDSVLSHSSTLRAGHGPGEGSVRESLILLKARKKSLTSMRSSRPPLTGQEQETAGDDDSLAEMSVHSTRHNRRSNAFTDDLHSVVSEQSNSSSQYPSRPPLSKTTVPFSGGGTDGAYSLKSHLARSSVPADSTSVDSTQGRNQNQNQSQHTSAMHPCPHCGRSFGSESLSRHVQICVKIFSKKRQVFDSVQMRGIDENNWAIPRTGVQGKSSQRAHPIGGRDGGRAQTEDQPPKWKVQSDMFRESLKAARVSTDAIASGKPLPPSTRSIDPTLVPCPHCSRRFNQKAAERHIPVCSSIRAKPTMLLRGTGVGPGQATHSKTLPIPSRSSY